MTGTALSWQNEFYKSFGFILGEDGKRYWVSDREIHNDCLGRRYLLKDEPANFTPALDKNEKLIARDVIRPWAETGEGKKGFALSLYREACEVIYNDGPGQNDKRYLLRIIGGHLHFSAKNHQHLFPGMMVEVGLRPNLKPNGVWKAVHIRRICDSREEFYGLPPEKQRARPSFASLAPRGRA